MKFPTRDFTHLWNDLPKEQRDHLYPHMLESQILHIWQTKHKAMAAHEAHMKELKEWIGNIEHELNKYRENKL